MDATEPKPQPVPAPLLWNRWGRYASIGFCTLTVTYWLAFFPACWIVMRYHDHPQYGRTVRELGGVYAPVVYAIVRLPRPFRDVVDWGIGLGAPQGITVNTADPTGIRWDGPGYNYTFLGW